MLVTPRISKVSHHPRNFAKLRHQGGLADDAGSHTQAHDRRHIPADADPMAMLLSEDFYHILGYTWIYWVIWCIYIYIHKHKHKRIHIHIHIHIYIYIYINIIYI